ncbi:permease-like domain protein [Burkholderia pseudomallei MSHR4304]|nr:permease-like domain protein [Burkholderia pseudomallei MSHR4304]
MPVCSTRCSQPSSSWLWSTASTSPAAIGTTTSSATAEVSKAATSVARPRNAGSASIRRSAGHSAIATTHAHAIAGMKSRITHNASATSAAYSAPSAIDWAFGRPADAGGTDAFWTMRTLREK